MSFPVFLGFGAYRIHPHLLFELLAYFVGFRLYLRDRRRQGDFLEDARRWWVIAAAAAGAALGARLVALFECPLELLVDPKAAIARLGGKTIVGAIAGGWLAVELVKRALEIESRTGDLLAIPLAVAIAIGRVGCFLTGAADRTFGAPTSSSWGADFGDGVKRLPMPLYELVFLMLLVALLLGLRRKRSLPAPGDLFRVFVAGYFSFRLAADFWKSADCRMLGLSTIQWVALFALVALVPDLWRWARADRKLGPTDDEVR